MGTRRRREEHNEPLEAAAAAPTPMLAASASAVAGSERRRLLGPRRTGTRSPRHSDRTGPTSGQAAGASAPSAPGPPGPDRTKLLEPDHRGPTRSRPRAASGREAVIPTVTRMGEGGAGFKLRAFVF